jgi:hypothetical protein
MSNECWAASLGDCSNKITGEHILTRGLFPQDEMFIQGLPWCLDEPKLIGIANLTAKILCSKHNSGLSEIDTAAIQTAQAFRDALALRDFRAQHKPTHWTRRQFRINGRLLESWALKSLINITYKGPSPIGGDSSEPGRASASLVETAFGLRRFTKPAGLYTLARVGDENFTDGRVRIITLGSTAGHIAGAIFHFGGLRYLLYLENDRSPDPKNFVGLEGHQIQASQIMYHLRQVKVPVHDILSHTIDFRW